MFFPNLDMVKLGIAAAIAAALLGTGWHFGANSVEVKWRADQAAWEAREAALDAENARLIEQAREVERHQVQVVNNIATELQKAQNETQSLKHAVATGALRLSVPTQQARCPSQPASAGTAPAAGDRNQARAELDQQTAGNLVAITNDGDAAIRQLNACIDAYNAIRGKP